MNLETHHRMGDPDPVRITREIPLAWLIGVVAAMFVVMLGGPDLFALFDALCYRKGANP